MAVFVGGVTPPAEPQGPPPTFQDYPKIMIHPHAVKAAVNVDAQGNSIPGLIAQADKFPPVTVANADAEAWHRAQGYVEGGKSDATAFANAHAGPVSTHVHIEWPKWVEGVLYESEAAWLAANPPTPRTDASPRHVRTPTQRRGPNRRRRKA